MKVSVARHPDGSEIGNREWDMDDGSILIEENDLKNNKIRLKDFADIQISENKAIVESWEKTDKRQIVHWLPSSMAISATLTRNKGDSLVIEEGLIENFELNKGAVIQLERVGFARIESVQEDGKVNLLFLHG
jgi:hypothetical protein